MKAIVTKKPMMNVATAKKSKDHLPSIIRAKKFVGFLLLIGSLLAICIELFQMKISLSQAGPLFLEPALQVSQYPSQLAVERLNENLANKSLSGLLATGYIQEATLYDDYDRVLDVQTTTFNQRPNVELLSRLLSINLRETVEVALPINTGFSGRLVVLTNYQEILHRQFLQSLIRLLPLSVLDVIVWLILSNYMSFNIIKTVKTISTWSRKFSIGKTKKLPESFELKYEEFKLMVSQLKLAFEERHEAEASMQNQYEFQKRILKVVSGSLTLTQQYASLYDRSGQVVFSNAKHISNPEIQKLFERKHFDLGSLVRTLELNQAEVELVSHDDEDDDEAAGTSLFVSIKGEFWKIQIYPIQDDYIFLSAIDATSLVEAQNLQLLKGNLEAAGSIAETAWRNFLKNLTYFSTRLDSLESNENITAEMRDNINELTRINDKSIETVSEYLRLSSHQLEESALIDVSDWLDILARRLQTIFGESLSIGVYCAEGIQITAKASVLNANIFCIIDRIFWQSQTFGNIDIDVREVTGVEIIHAGNLNAKKSYACIKVVMEQGRPVVNLDELPQAELEKWRERDVARNYAIWSVKEFAKISKGDFRIIDNPKQQIVELYLPL